MKMTHAFSRTLRVLAVAVAALSLSMSAWAQATQAKQQYWRAQGHHYSVEG